MIAPGLIGYVSAVYGQHCQGGVNLNTGALGPDSNNVKVLGGALGLHVRW